MPAIAAVGQVAITNGVIGVDYIGGNYVPIYGNSDLLASPRITPPGTTTTTNIRNATGIYQSLIIAFNTPAVVSNLSVFDHNTGVYLINTAQVGATPTIVPLPPDGGAGYDVTVTVSSGGQSYYIFGSRLPMHQAVSNVGQTPLAVQGAVQVATASGQYVTSRSLTAPLAQITVPVAAGTYTYTVTPDVGANGIKLSFGNVNSFTQITVVGNTTARNYYMSQVKTTRPIYIPIPMAYDTSLTITVAVNGGPGLLLWVEEVFGNEIPAKPSNHVFPTSYAVNGGIINFADLATGITVIFNLEGWDISVGINVPAGSAASNELVRISIVSNPSGKVFVLGNFAFACPAVPAGVAGVTLTQDKTIHLGEDWVDLQSFLAGETSINIHYEYGAFAPVIGLTLYQM